MMSTHDSETANGMGYYQKKSSRVLGPAPIPNGEEIARRKEHDGHGDPCTSKVTARTVVRDGEICVKIGKPEGGSHPGAFASGAVLSYHQWAQSGYTPESWMERCPDCEEICSSEYWNDDEPGCVFCNHPDL